MSKAKKDVKDMATLSVKKDKDGNDVKISIITGEKKGDLLKRIASVYAGESVKLPKV